MVFLCLRYILINLEPRIIHHFKIREANDLFFVLILGVCGLFKGAGYLSKYGNAADIKGERVFARK